MSFKTHEVERLMKACQMGVGGHGALDRAHNVMAECYGKLGALVAERDELLREIARRQRGECICVNCGLRQDAESKSGERSGEKDPFPF